MRGIVVKRTGAAYSIASSEFNVTFPDGVEISLWSPAWHDMTPEEEESGAMEYAAQLFATGDHLGISKVQKERHEAT